MAGHAFLASVVTTARITNGTQDFTVSGIGTPKGIIVLMSGGTSDGSISNTAGLTIGFCDGTNQVCLGIRSLDNQADSETSRVFDFTSVVHLPNPGGTGTTMKATFDSWITDGVRLNVNPADSAYYITVIFLCGSELSCKVGNFDMSDHTGTPNQTLDVTGCGFNPNLAFFLSCIDIPGLNTSGSTVTQNAAYSLGIGIADDSADPPTVVTAITSFTHRDARATSQPSFHSGQGTQGRISTGFVGAASGALTHVGPVNLDAWITDGFRVKDVPGGNPPVVAYLAVNMSDRSMRLVAADAVPANSTFTVSVPEPGSSFVMSTSADALGDKTDSQSTGICYGVYTLTGQHSVGFNDQDGVSTMNTASIASIDTVILNQQHDNTGGLDYQGSHDNTTLTFTKNVNAHAHTTKQLVLGIQRPSFNGTSAGSFPKLTASGAGTIPYIGSGAGVLPLADGDGSADLAFIGSAAGSFATPTGSGSADLVFQGTGAGSFATPTGTGSADLAFSGTSAGVLPLPQASADADLVFIAAGAGSFPLAAGDGSADLAFIGAAAGSFPLPLGSGAADLAFIGAAAGSFPTVAGDGSADLAFIGAGSGSFPLLAGDGTGITAQTYVGTGAGVFPLPDGLGSADLVFQGTSAGVLPLLTGTGTGRPGAGLGCTVDLLGSSDVVTELEGSYALAQELEGSYDAVTELEGGVC